MPKYPQHKFLEQCKQALLEFPPETPVDIEYWDDDEKDLLTYGPFHFKSENFINTNPLVKVESTTLLTVKAMYEVQIASMEIEDYYS